MSSDPKVEQKVIVLSVDNKTPISIISTVKTTFHTIPIAIGKKLKNVYFTNMGIIKRISPVITNCIEDTEDSEDPLPITSIENDVFKCVMEYAEKDEMNDTIDKPYNNKEISLLEWELEFFDKPMDIILNLIQAANYLNYVKLLEKTGMFIASVIKKADPADLRKMFSSEIVKPEIADVKIPAASSENATKDE